MKTHKVEVEVEEEGTEQWYNEDDKSDVFTENSIEIIEEETKSFFKSFN